MKYKGYCFAADMYIVRILLEAVAYSNGGDKESLNNGHIGM